MRSRGDAALQYSLRLSWKVAVMPDIANKSDGLPHDPTIVPPDAASAPVRQPPQSINSEQAILGGLLVDNTALDSVVDVIKPEDFCRRDHRMIYEQIAQIIQRGQPADTLTVSEALKKPLHPLKPVLSYRLIADGWGIAVENRLQFLCRSYHGHKSNSFAGFGTYATCVTIITFKFCL